MRKGSGFRWIYIKYDPKLKFSIFMLNGQNLDKILQAIGVDEKEG